MGHFISETVGTFETPQSQASCMYWEYLMEGLTFHITVVDYRSLMIMTRYIWLELTETTLAHSQQFSFMLFRSKRLTKVPLLTQRHQILTWVCDITDRTLGN